MQIEQRACAGDGGVRRSLFTRAGRDRCDEILAGFRPRLVRVEDDTKKR